MAKKVIEYRGATSDSPDDQFIGNTRICGDILLYDTEGHAFESLPTAFASLGEAKVYGKPVTIRITVEVLE